MAKKEQKEYRFRNRLMGHIRQIVEKREAAEKARVANLPENQFAQMVSGPFRGGAGPFPKDVLVNVVVQLFPDRPGLLFRDDVMDVVVQPAALTQSELAIVKAKWLECLRSGEKAERDDWVQFVARLPKWRPSARQ